MNVLLRIFVLLLCMIMQNEYAFAAHGQERELSGKLSCGMGSNNDIVCTINDVWFFNENAQKLIDKCGMGNNCVVRVSMKDSTVADAIIEKKRPNAALLKLNGVWSIDGVNTKISEEQIPKEDLQLYKLLLPMIAIILMDVNVEENIVTIYILDEKKIFPLPRITVDGAVYTVYYDDEGKQIPFFFRDANTIISEDVASGARLVIRRKEN